MSRRWFKKIVFLGENKEMKVSIITVCYNSERTIRQTIESVINQDCEDIEYIVIDGGSTDGTVDIIEEYSDRIVYWCSEKDNGIYDAMNKGIGKSTGDIIAFMNSDDFYYDSNVLKKVVLCFENYNADIVYGDFLRIYEEAEKDCRYFSVADKSIDSLYFSFPFCHQAMFMKKKLFDTLGGYNTEYKLAADQEWILKAYLNNAKFQYIAICICYFRQGGASFQECGQGAEECINLRLSMLPKEKKSLYYDKIIETYGDFKIEKVITECMFTCDERKRKKIYECLEKNSKKLILWGAGVRGRKIKKALNKIGIDIILFMDNDKEKWGLTIDGIKVEKPSFISDENIKILIAMINHGKEVKKQLLSLGYSEKNILYERDFFREAYDKIRTQE